MDDWKKIIGSIAPAIAAGFGGPLAGTAVKFMADKLLGNPGAGEDEIAAFVVGASPDQLLKLKELDKIYQQEMVRAGVDVFKFTVEDKKSAREMAQATSLLPQITISIVYNIGYFILLYVMIESSDTLNAINTDFKMLFSALLGIMTTEIPRINSFWFGSSMGSKMKNKFFKEK